MSPLGQKRTFHEVQMMSALLPKADIGRACRYIRFTPKRRCVAAQKSGLLDHFVDGAKARSAPYTDCLGEYRLHVTGQRSSRPTPYKPLSAYLLF
jgi:hypothetical protein